MAMKLSVVALVLFKKVLGYTPIQKMNRTSGAKMAISRQERSFSSAFFGL